MNVIKRDKTVEIFQVEKIFSAVERAFESCKARLPDELREYLRTLYDENDDTDVTVEEIQDKVENTLLCQFPEVAKNYIIYRYNHKVIREHRDKLIKGLSKKLMAQDVENQNANVDEHSFGGRMGEANRIVTKDYALNYCMSRKSRKNHLNNEIYIHDLDSYAVGMHNCLTIPFDELLEKGFNTRQTDVRPANSINTAFQLVAVIFQLQSLQQFGRVILPVKPFPLINGVS
jgi:ribonucleoside-triphosphate reductase